MIPFTPPKPLVRAGVSVLTYRTARRLRRANEAVPAQAKAFARLSSAFAVCDYGRENGIQNSMTYSRFRAQVPLRTYEQFAPWIERMKRGEANLLWPGQCAHYAVSSGTTAGRTKFLPITREMLGHFRQAGLDSLLYYTARTGSTSVFSGKQLFLGGSTALSPLPEARPFTAFGGDLSGITALNLPHWVEKHLYEPGREIAQIADWPEKIQAIAARVASSNITLLAGIPSWILILAEAFRQRAPHVSCLRDLFPNLECLVHGGVPITPYIDELGAALGQGVNFHEVYPASEGFIATQDADAGAGLRLMADTGLFFEFLPMSVFDENRLEQLGDQAVPLEEVKVGTDYALILTTPAGLCRYVIGDVVRFVSTQPARLIYVGRTRLQLSAFGEHVIEKELTDALITTSKQHGLTLSQFHVAPVFVNSQSGNHRGRHQWWIECKPGMGLPPQEEFAAQLDAELIRFNDDYDAKRKGGGLEPPEVIFLPSGSFENWLKQKGKWGGQNKMPRCRSDRQIADDLELFLNRS